MLAGGARRFVGVVGGLGPSGPALALSKESWTVSIVRMVACLLPLRGVPLLPLPVSAAGSCWPPRVLPLRRGVLPLPFFRGVAPRACCGEDAALCLSLGSTPSLGGAEAPCWAVARAEASRQGSFAAGSAPEDLIERGLEEVALCSAAATPIVSSDQRLTHAVRGARRCGGRFLNSPASETYSTTFGMSITRMTLACEIMGRDAPLNFRRSNAQKN